MQHLDEHRFIDANTLAEALATAIQRVLRIAIAARGRASLVVSGGRTPRRFFNRLAALPLDWRKVVITNALPLGQPFARAQIERHTRPAPIVDNAFQRDEGFGIRFRIDAFFAAVS